MKKYKREKKVEELDKPATGKKDTKKWCKGKVGRGHKLEWKDATKYASICVHIKTCIVCGKQFDYCFSPSWFKNEKCSCKNHGDK